MKKLEGKNIIVVGATGDIGSVLCKRFVEEGAQVVLAARNPENLARLEKELGQNSWIRQTDAEDMIDIEALFQESTEKYGKIDAVVISVGTWDRLSKDDDFEQAERMQEKHHEAIFKPVFNVGFVAQKFFQKQDEGLIVNIDSHVSVRPFLKGNLSYLPMKGAGRLFMLGLIAELADTKVRITDLQPSLVNTPKNRESLPKLTEEDWAKAVQPEEIADWIIDNFDNPDIPAERLFEGKIRV